MTSPAWKRTLLTCFDVKERPSDSSSTVARTYHPSAKLFSCRFCADPSWQDKPEDSVTRLLEHITGLRRRDGKAKKQCVGQVPLEVRNQLRDYMQSAVRQGQSVTRTPATSTRRAASEQTGNPRAEKNRRLQQRQGWRQESVSSPR